MKDLSIKQIIVGAFVFVIIMTSCIIGYIIPNQVTEELSQNLDSEVIPSVQNNLGDLSSQVSEELEHYLSNTEKEDIQSFDESSRALAGQLSSLFLPFSENFDVDGIETLAKSEIENIPELKKIDIQMEKGGPWASYEEQSSHQIDKEFDSMKESSFGYVAVKIYLDSSIIKK